MDILPLALGWAAIPVAILRFQMRGIKAMLLCNGLGLALLAGHMALLGMVAPAIITATASSAAFLQALLGRHLRLKGRLAIAIPPILVCVALNITGVSSLAGLLPIACFTIGRLSEILDDALHLRAMNLASMAIWVVYYLIEGSMAGLAFNLIGITSNLVGIYRFHGDRVWHAFHRPATKAEIA